MEIVVIKFGRYWYLCLSLWQQIQKGNNDINSGKFHSLDTTPDYRVGGYVRSQRELQTTS